MHGGVGRFSVLVLYFWCNAFGSIGVVSCGFLVECFFVRGVFFGLCGSGRAPCFFGRGCTARGSIACFSLVFWGRGGLVGTTAVDVGTGTFSTVCSLTSNAWIFSRVRCTRPRPAAGVRCDLASYRFVWSIGGVVVVRAIGGGVGAGCFGGG